MASEAKHTPEEWVCCGCGAPSPELKRVCDCPTGLLYDRNNVGKTIRAKEDPEEPSPLWTTERFESVEAHFYAGGTASPQNGVELFEQLKLTRNALSLSQSRVELMRKALEEVRNLDRARVRKALAPGEEPNPAAVALAKAGKIASEALEDSSHGL